MIRISQLKININVKDKEKLLQKKICDILNIREQDIKRTVIVKQSVDARKKPDINYIYTVDVLTDLEKRILKKNKNPQVCQAEETKYQFPYQNSNAVTRPIIVGSGPAGLFCGYYLAKAGFAPIILERGSDVDERIKEVEQFWNHNHLNPESNVQFGEGGAGTFSDGKLNTLVKDKDGRNHAVLELFTQMGAKESILYEAKPHIGTDMLCKIVKNIRQEIINSGGEVRFHSKVTEILCEETEAGKVNAVVINDKEKVKCECLVLAIGHSARDTFQMLWRKKLPMEAKSFAVGFRVEHPQKMINNSQYGTEEVKELGAASYKLTAQTSFGRGVYTFCMCPGGYVVNASSEEGMTAVNGMSYSGRDGENANSAVIVSVTPKDFGSDHPLAGVEFQRTLERKAFEKGNGKIPVQRYGEFRSRILEQTYEETELPLTDPCCKGNFQYADLTDLLPEECSCAFVEGMSQFGKMISGFDRDDCILSGVESRTSSPVRIVRGEGMQIQNTGIFPCGEGAGYAGGITSAAMDGIKVAEAVARFILVKKREMELTESKK